MLCAVQQLLCDTGWILNSMPIFVVEWSLSVCNIANEQGTKADDIMQGEIRGAFKAAPSLKSSITLCSIWRACKTGPKSVASPLV